MDLKKNTSTENTNAPVKNLKYNDSRAERKIKSSRNNGRKLVIRPYDWRNFASRKLVPRNVLSECTISNYPQPKQAYINRNEGTDKVAENKINALRNFGQLSEHNSPKRFPAIMLPQYEITQQSGQNNNIIQVPTKISKFAQTDPVIFVSEKEYRIIQIYKINNMNSDQIETSEEPKMFENNNIAEQPNIEVRKEVTLTKEKNEPTEAEKSVIDNDSDSEDKGRVIVKDPIEKLVEYSNYNKSLLRKRINETLQETFGKKVNEENKILNDTNTSSSSINKNSLNDNKINNNITKTECSVQNTKTISSENMTCHLNCGQINNNNTYQSTSNTSLCPKAKPLHQYQKISYSIEIPDTKSQESNCEMDSDTENRLHMQYLARRLTKPMQLTTPAQKPPISVTPHEPDNSIKEEEEEHNKEVCYNQNSYQGINHFTQEHFASNLQQPANATQGPDQKIQQPAINMQHTPINIQQSVLNTQRQAFNSQRPAFNSQRPAYNMQQTAFNSQQPALNMQPPAFNTQRPAGTMQGSANFMQRPTNTTERPTNFMQQTADSAERPINFIPRPADSIVRPANILQRSADTTEQPNNFMHRPTDTIVRPANCVLRSCDGLHQRVQNMHQHQYNMYGQFNNVHRSDQYPHPQGLQHIQYGGMVYIENAPAQNMVTNWSWDDRNMHVTRGWS